MPLSANVLTPNTPREADVYPMTLHKVEAGVRKAYQAAEGAPKEPCFFWRCEVATVENEEVTEDYTVITNTLYGPSRALCTKLIDCIFDLSPDDDVRRAQVKNIDLEKMAIHEGVKIGVMITIEAGKNKVAGFKRIDEPVPHDKYLLNEPAK